VISCALRPCRVKTDAPRLVPHWRRKDYIYVQFPLFFVTAPLDFFLLASESRLLSDSLQGPTLCRRRLSIISLQVTLKSTNSFVLASIQSRCFIIQSFLLQCYFISYCIAVCLQVGKMAVRCHPSFFRAGKSTPSSLSLKSSPGRDSVEECREAFLKCLCLTALKVRAFVIRWNGGTRTSTGNCIVPSKLAHGIRLSDPNAHSRTSKFALS